MRAAGFRPMEDHVTLEREKKQRKNTSLHSVRTYFCAHNSRFFLSSPTNLHRLEKSEFSETLETLGRESSQESRRWTVLLE